MFTLELPRVHLFCVIFLFCLFYKKKKKSQFTGAIGGQGLS